MRFSSARFRILSGLLSGLLYGLSFPPFNLHWLAWIALIPLVRSVKSFPSRASFLNGLGAGFLANLLIFWWMWKTFEAAKIGFITTLGAWLALAFVLALYMGFFALVYAKLPTRWWRPWVAALVWVGLDVVRTYALTGFPWALLAHTQVYFLPLLQIASVGGAGAITYVIVLFGTSAAEMRSFPKNFGVVCATLALILLWGMNRLRSNPVNTTSTPMLNVVIVQGNIDQYQKWDALYENSIRERYENLVMEAAQQQPDLIVWPESAVPGWFPNQQVYYDWVKDVAIRSKTINIIGAVTAHSGKEYNAAFLIDPEGRIVNEYDKEHLVPFGEYIPFGGFLKRWVPYLGQLGTFDAGENPAVFEVRGARLAPTICYEAIFPSLVRRAIYNRADILVNITNDGWFLDTGAPEQHYVTNIFRAVENQCPVIRSANTGISGVIDPFGRELVRTPLLASGVFSASVCYTPSHVTRTEKSDRNALQKG